MDSKKEYKTRIIFENETNRQIWESIYFDESLENIVTAFMNLCIGSGWMQESVAETMVAVGQEKLDYLDKEKNKKNVD